MPVKKAIIVAKNVSASYQTKTVWRDASFEIATGEFVAVLGANGAGKTTLFRLLLGLEAPVSGVLELFNAKPKRGNSLVGYIPQRRPIDNESRIESLEYVRFGLSGNKWGFAIDKSADKERALALEALKLVDAENLASRPLSELSGGEMQRVFLAQALVGKPRLLLLDEPLANLDIRREVEIIQLVKNVVRSQRITALLIAHDINPLIPVVDRIMYIANRSIALGRLDEVVTSERLSALYDAPIEVVRSPGGRLAVLGIEEAVHHDT
jgi:zinc/manganese transport system ATP-binding protein